MKYSALETPKPCTDSYGFGFNCTNRDVETRKLCDERQTRQLQEWESCWKEKKLPKPEKLKKLCRKGIPLELRAWVWMKMSGAEEKKKQHLAGYFDEMLRLGTTPECKHQIELDLRRTFPRNQWIAGPAGQKALRNVLTAFAAFCSRIGYCQSMNYVAAMLLLVADQNEENAFWLLVALISDGGILYPEMYTSNLSGAHVEMRALGELVHKKLPELSKHLEKLNCDMSIISTDWFLCLFCTVLPSETTARVWDSLFNEGTKILYRVSIALLKLHEPELLKKDNPGDLTQRLRECTSVFHDRDGLMEYAFGELGSFPMERIHKLRRQEQIVVDKEDEMRRHREELRKKNSDNGSAKPAAASESIEDFIKRNDLRHAKFLDRINGKIGTT